MKRPRISDADFTKTVEDAIASLPPEFAAALHNVAIVVEEEPTDDDLDDLEDDDSDESELLGIFRGVPATEHSHFDTPMLPPVIALFRGPILRVCETREEALEEIRLTLIHEIGHLVGLEDDEMPY